MKVVLLHALPLDERMWAPQRAALAGHEAIAPNLYRLGNSMDAWADGVLADLPEELVVCGSSMGGYCALAIARRAPARVAALVLAGARADADSPQRRAGREETIDLIRNGGAAGLWESMQPKLFSMSAPAEVVGRARRIALDQDPEGLAGAVGTIRDRPDSREVVASLEVPILIAVGERDPFITVEEARATAESARSGRLHVFENAGHLPSMERPEEFNRLLLDLLP